MAHEVAVVDGYRKQVREENGSESFDPIITNKGGVRVRAAFTPLKKKKPETETKEIRWRQTMTPYCQLLWFSVETG